MYNLFISSQLGCWESSTYEYDRSRFLEYTNEEIIKKIKNNYDLLMTFPCLFGYEQFEADFYIGKLISIKDRGKNIFIEFELDSEIGKLSASIIRENSTLLDIRAWEISRTHWALKDEPLFDRLVNSGLITNDQKENQLLKFKENSSSKSQLTNDKYVMSLGSFIKKVFEIEKTSDKSFFYRGHSKKDIYKLVPSLFRTDEQGNYKYLHSEDVLYREMLISNPTAFSGFSSTLDILIKMQHYSLPTRLLDITSNPLIALNFSCCSNNDTEGEVIIFGIKNKQIKYYDSDTVSCLSNLARLPQKEQNEINFSNEEFNNQLPILRLIHFIKEEKPFFEPEIKPEDLQKVVCVKGKLNNDRILSQSGAFFLFGINAVLDEKGTDEIEIIRISIRNKAKILEELDQLNINESTVFPYLENSAKFIANKYAKKS
jgi:hypothetical protein